MRNHIVNRRASWGHLAAFAACARSLHGGTTTGPAQSGQSLPSRRTVVSCPTANAEEFRRLAGICAEPDVTHLDISGLPKARWQWIDPSDPWPKWGMLQASFFKIAPPDMDNTRERIVLLQSTTVPLFGTAPTAAEEDVFLFNPALVDQLHKKIAITQAHLPEYIRF